MAEILVKVIRGETVESVHRGDLIIIDGDGKNVAQIGDADSVTFIRSSAKSFQAIPFLTGGAADAFGFTEEEIALACASHSGEKRHTKIAARMLEKVNLSETDLQCGAQLPFNEKRAEEMIRAGEQPTQLHNNCSGKHAAMLAFTKHAGADLKNYLEIESPVQQQILETFATFTETAKDKIKLGIDGCSAPNFAVSLRAMAKGFLNLMSPPRFDENLQNACRRIVAAALKYPELIGGTQRLDTILMRAATGKIISKVGAEGVWLSAVLPSEKWRTGLSIALKIEDGDDQRARAVASVEILRQLGVLAKDALADISPLPIMSRRGAIVGQIAADFEI